VVNLSDAPSPPQAVNDVQRGNYVTKLSDAIKLAAIQCYVLYGPFDESKEQFSIQHMRDFKIGEQLMPTPLVTAQVRRCLRQVVLSRSQRLGPTISLLMVSG